MVRSSPSSTVVVRLVCRLSLEPDSCVRRTEEIFSRYGARSLLVAKFARDDLQAATSRHVVQIAETVVKSTRLAMLLNDRHMVQGISEEQGFKLGT